MDLTKFLKKGLRSTILLKGGIHFSYEGMWKEVKSDLVIDEWHMGDFSSAEYTINVENGKDIKEVIKVLLTASPDTASVVVYGRASTTRDIVSVTTSVTNSYVQLILNPKTAADKGAKAFFSATYFRSHA
jgi:hypothetical protein